MEPLEGKSARRRRFQGHFEMVKISRGDLGGSLCTLPVDREDRWPFLFPDTISMIVLLPQSSKCLWNLLFPSPLVTHFVSHFLVPLSPLERDLLTNVFPRTPSSAHREIHPLRTPPPTLIYSKLIASLL